MDAIWDENLPQVELVRRFVQRIINEKRLDELDQAVSADLDFDHRRSGQQTGIDGFAESLNALFNAVPNVYVELVTTTSNAQTVVADCAISGSVLIWPIYHQRITIDHFVIVFGIARGKIRSIQSLRAPEEERGDDDDDDDGGAGPAPAGPRWVPRRPPPGSRNQPEEAGPRWLPHRRTGGPGGLPTTPLG